VDFAFASATELAAALREKRISSRELLDLYLRRIERYNPAVNAVVTVDAERARGDAGAADDELARGELRGPLHGLPMTIKDSIETAGMLSTAGAPILADYVPERDADAVARLRAAGAVIFGKTNVPLFASDFQSYNEVFGTTNNPWDLARAPGGSSGGAAAALAAGFTSFELGSDIGGSIRNPAHYCGVYGHKPTYGIVPGRGHLPPGQLAPTDISVLGPLGRGADDLDLGLDVLAGPDEATATAWALTLPPPRRRSVGEYRIAAWLDDPSAPIDRSVQSAIGGAIDALRAAGATVDEEARPGFTFEEAVDVYERLMYPAIARAVPQETYDEMAGQAAVADPADRSPRTRFARNVTARHRAWQTANERRHQIRALWAQFFRSYDAVLCPVAPTAAFLHDHNPDLDARTVEVNGTRRRVSEMGAWAGLSNAYFLPSTVAPVGRTAAGLPVGVQIVGPYLEDRTTIDIARRLAGLIGGFVAPPGYESVEAVAEGAQR
jgi:amidase